MKTLKLFLISIALSLVFFSNACEYTPSDTDYYVDIDKPEEKEIEFWSELSPEIDTFYCQPEPWERNYVSEINIPDIENKVIFIRIKKNGVNIDSSYTTIFKFPVRNQLLHLLDPYELTLEIYAKTSSGSLADNVDKEAYIMKHSWTIIPFEADSLKNKLVFEEENGKLKVNVDCMRGSFIREVSVMRLTTEYDQGNYWTVFDSTTNQEYFYDEDYVGQEANYRIIYKLKSNYHDSIAMPLIFKESEKMYLATEWKNDKFYLSWQKPKYYTNVIGYEIYTVTTSPNNTRTKIQTIDNGSILETPIELSDYYRQPYTLLLIPKSSSGSFKMSDKIYSYDLVKYYSNLQNVSSNIPFYKFDEIMRYKDDFMVFSSKNSLKIYNYKTNELVAETEEYSEPVYFSVSPNRQILAWGSAEKIYFTQSTNFNSYDQMEILLLPYSWNINNIMVSDNNYALLEKRGFMRVNLTTKKVEEIMYPKNNPDILSFSKNAKHYLESGLTTGYLKTYENGLLDSIKVQNLKSGCFSRFDENILYWNKNGKVYEYNIESKTEKLITEFSDAKNINCIDKYLYLYGNSELKIYDVNTLKLVDEGTSNVDSYIYPGETNKSTLTENMLFFSGKKFYRRSK